MKSNSSVLAVLGTLATLSTTFASERIATLRVDLKVNSREEWRNDAGTDSAKVNLTQHVTFSTAVKSDGELVDFNYKDPNYGQQQMAKASQVASAVTKAQGQKPMTQAEFQQRAQKEQAACNGDMQCLMKLSEKLSQWTIQMTAGMPQTAPPEQGSGSYLNFYGFERCGAKIHIDMQSVTEGHYADVQGPVPFSVSSTANYDGSPVERELLCTQTNFVLDVPNKMLHGDGWLIAPPRGTTIGVNRGKTRTVQQQLPFREEIIAWANQQLRNAPVTGSRKGMVKMKSANGTGIPFAVTQGGGTAEVEMSWRFE